MKTAVVGVVKASISSSGGVGKRPLWTLAGPPPGTFTPRYAAYDPNSYELLCLPGEEARSTAVSRLWQAGLLAAVV